jgi:ATP-dependent helicase/nuclease subunit A
LFALDGGPGTDPILAWSPRKADDCPEVAVAREKSREASDEEYRRLLYVALTRAEERLYIAGFYGVRAPPPGCWYEMMRATFENTFEKVPAFWDCDDTLLRQVSPNALQLALFPPDPPSPIPTATIPDWLRAPAPHEAVPRLPLRPSSALAAADAMEAAVSPAQRDAMRRGQLMHVLLQYLPAVAKELRLTKGEAFLAARAPELTQAARTDLVSTVLCVLDAPALIQLFSADSKAEVPISGRVMRADGSSIDVLGQVDRIAESATEVLIADFKTGQPCGADKTPRDYLTQMALYRAALRPLWPQKRLRMLLIWTYGPMIVEITDATLENALAGL